MSWPASGGIRVLSGFDEPCPGHCDWPSAQATPCRWPARSGEPLVAATQRCGISSSRRGGGRDQTRQGRGAGYSGQDLSGDDGSASSRHDAGDHPALLQNPANLGIARDSLRNGATRPAAGRRKDHKKAPEPRRPGAQVAERGTVNWKGGGSKAALLTSNISHESHL